MEIRQLAPHFTAEAELRLSRQTRSIPRVIVSVLVSLLLQPTIRGQSWDWQAVERLRPGDQVWVTTQHRLLCTVERVTQEELICEVHRRHIGLTTLTIPRSEVAQIREFVRPNQPREAAIGTLIGLGAGAVLGASGSDNSRGFHAFFGGLGGAGFGVLIGVTVATGRLAFQHGKIIYKR